ncbi:MAG: hypothetical protein ACNYZH_00675 [Acidimicrobiia bacterium]
MGDPFTAASWSMGYTQLATTAPPIRSIDDGDYEVPGKDRSWWTARLEPAISTGLRDLEWHPSEDGDTTYWGVRGTYGGGSVSARVPRLLEHRDGTPVSDEIMVIADCHITPSRLGSWVIESPPKWFRRRRGWALNRPKFSTGDPWFDKEAGCWAWDCADGPDALCDALVPALPTIREILDAHPGAIITEATISTWIPDEEVSERLPRLLSAVRSPSRGPAPS